jgi:hypothetical protein
MRVPMSLLPLLVHLDTVGAAARIDDDVSAYDPPHSIAEAGTGSATYLAWATKQATVRHCRLDVGGAWSLQRTALASRPPLDSELTGHAYVNLAIYAASMGRLDWAEDALGRLTGRSPRLRDPQDAWERVWLRADQVEAVMRSIRGRHVEALDLQRAAMAGLAQIDVADNADIAQARLVLAGILLRTGAYVSAKEEAAAIAAQLARATPREPVAALLPAVVTAFADIGLDRFREAVDGLAACRSRLQPKERMSPLGQFVDLVVGFATLQTPSGDETASRSLAVHAETLPLGWGECRRRLNTDPLSPVEN